MKVTHIKINKQLSLMLNWGVPLLLSVFIYGLSFFPGIIEGYYSSLIYLFIADFNRVIIGWLPFSLGDVLYAFVIFIIFYWVLKALKLIFKKQMSWPFFLKGCLKLIKILLWVYIIFNVLWALNYSRLGVAYQLHLKQTNYSTDELQNITCDILEKMNHSRIALGDSNYQYPTNTIIFRQAFDAYQQTKNSFSFLNYQHFSVKPSLLSAVVSYAGYSGYYNPFTGEAQLNTDLPKFTMPFVTCHEMAHQLGYASESEANFVGYLAASNSNNKLFVYSAYFDAFMSANGELFTKDFYAAYLNLLQTNSLVKKDRKIYKDYILGKQNNLQPVMHKLYNQYLKANQQKSGINSYNEVVGLLIAYKKVYGKI